MWRPSGQVARVEPSNSREMIRSERAGWASFLHGLRPGAPFLSSLPADLENRHLRSSLAKGPPDHLPVKLLLLNGCLEALGGKSPFFPDRMLIDLGGGSFLQPEGSDPFAGPARRTASIRQHSRCPNGYRLSREGMYR
jgi:hypothetical protein